LSSPDLCPHRVAHVEITPLALILFDLSCLLWVSRWEEARIAVSFCLFPHLSLRAQTIFVHCVPQDVHTKFLSCPCLLSWSLSFRDRVPSLMFGSTLELFLSLRRRFNPFLNEDVGTLFELFLSPQYRAQQADFSTFISDVSGFFSYLQRTVVPSPLFFSHHDHHDNVFHRQSRSHVFQHCLVIFLFTIPVFFFAPSLSFLVNSASCFNGVLIPFEQQFQFCFLSPCCRHHEIPVVFPNRPFGQS